MGMWSSAGLALLPLGVAALWWSIALFPIFRAAVPSREITQRILLDDRFKPGTLNAVLTQIMGEPERLVPRAEMARAEALVSLRVAEEVVQLQFGSEVDGEQGRAEDKVRESLALNPADSFLWLTLYSVTAARAGIKVGNLRYVDASYSAGPREGWVGLRRNRVALSIFSMLSPSAQHMVVSEFAELVDAGFVEVAAASLMGVGWPHRERLLAALQDVDPASKKRLRRRLLRDGVKVTIPNVEQEERPWQ